MFLDRFHYLSLELALNNFGEDICVFDCLQTLFDASQIHATPESSLNCFQSFSLFVIENFVRQHFVHVLVNASSVIGSTVSDLGKIFS